ncbi:hypothetical protein [Streptomyces lavenduligriseus]|uniref:Uncharacterized protein n=1 Tax=Streptomyces lavenduligriseus TaxID=67315 RepID=A0ABT0P3C5_9ACTN|nr:hypothetical protein [Streptomyces lavenduligriseus]MCL3998110.1 hypothetical protein [Streptomyces lavenduligriseus]
MEEATRGRTAGGPIALLLTGTARAVAADVRRDADLVPEDHAARALYERLNRLVSVAPQAATAAP